MQYLREIVRRRDLILHLAGANLKAAHRNAFLGYFWWLLDPLLGVLIYYFVVVVLFNRGGEGYGPYLVVGMVAWRWLSATVTGASRAIVSQAGLITQVYLPKAILPATTALTGLANFGFGLVVIALFLVFWGILPGVAFMWLPCVVLVQMLLTLALALVVAYVCVFLRDTDTLVGHALRIWFFMSPVIWTPEMVPDRFGWLVTLNPMAPVLAGYRSVLLANEPPAVVSLLVIGALSAAAVALMTYFYSRHEHHVIKAL